MTGLRRGLPTSAVLCHQTLARANACLRPNAHHVKPRGVLVQEGPASQVGHPSNSRPGNCMLCLSPWRAVVTVTVTVDPAIARKPDMSASAR